MFWNIFEMFQKQIFELLSKQIWNILEHCRMFLKKLKVLEHFEKQNNLDMLVNN